MTLANNYQFLLFRALLDPTGEGLKFGFSFYNAANPTDFHPNSFCPL